MIASVKRVSSALVLFLLSDLGCCSNIESFRELVSNTRAPTDRGREGESGGGERRGLQRKSLEVDKLREQGGVLKVKKKKKRVSTEI